MLPLEVHKVVECSTLFLPTHVTSVNWSNDNAVVQLFLLPSCPNCFSPRFGDIWYLDNIVHVYM